MRPMSMTEVRQWARKEDMDAARRMARAEVTEGRARPSRAGWVDRRALRLLPAVVAARRAAHHAQVERWEEEDRQARAVAQAAHLAAILASGPVGEGVTAHFAKGCVSVCIPPEVAAISCTECSALVGLNQDGEIIAAWRARSEGPQTWAYPVPVDGLEVRMFTGWRRPGTLSRRDVVFGRGGA